MKKIHCLWKLCELMTIHRIEKRFIINAVTDFPTEEDHNYKNYYSSFQRILIK